MVFKFVLITVFVSLFLIPKSIAAPDDTPDWWNCPNRTSGEWKFGRAPDVCDMDSFIDLDYVDNEFGEFVFEDTLSRDEERLRYMDEVYGLIKDVADYYISTRKPEATAEEIEIFLRSSFTIGHQESFWTHYRRPSHGTVQFMRSGGDYGHGHGIFQVDDRWHFPAVLDGRAANIVMNMVYSLEEYFHAWQTAPRMSCATSDDFVSRARSAYSAYNGGLKRICRWTNPNDRWARNDKGWWSKYQRQEWESYVSDLDRNSNVDIDCIVQGNEGCRRDGGDDDVTPKLGKIYKTSDDRYCSFNNEGFDCVLSNRDASCLALRGGDDFANYRGRFRRMPADFEQDYNLVNLDRHSLCSEYSSDLQLVGSSISLKKNINLRATPAGAWLVTIPRSTSVQVLDFFVKNSFKEDRYYKVKYKSHVGYVYAGHKGDSLQWASDSTEKSQYRLIAHTGDSVKVENEVGESIYNNSGEVVGHANLNDVLEVQNIFVRGDLNEITYEVGQDKFVRAGLSGDMLNLGEKFTVVVKNRTPDRQLARFKKSTWWKKIRVCPSKKCKKSGTIRGPRLSKKKFYLLEQRSGWGLIEQGSKKGWVKSKYIIKL
jgi:hypothetical protein